MRLYAIDLPSGLQVMRPPRSSGNGGAPRPPAGTSNRRPNQLFHAMRRERKTMFFESGVQVPTILSGPQRGGALSTTSEWKVRGFAAPAADLPQIALRLENDHSAVQRRKPHEGPVMRAAGHGLRPPHRDDRRKRRPAPDLELHACVLVLQRLPNRGSLEKPLTNRAAGLLASPVDARIGMLNKAKRPVADEPEP